MGRVRPPDQGLDHEWRGSTPRRSNLIYRLQLSGARQMTTTLGLDLGSNSIGWALFDNDAGRVVAAGVRIFPEGVDRDKQGGELSKNETRRVARGMRRQIIRRAKRKRHLRRVLIGAGLLSAQASPDIDRLDPYALRRRALTEKLQPDEIGRALCHLNQRRGFLSNRKADKAARKEASDMLAEISELQARIEQSGRGTLGAYLAHQNDQAPRVRLRGQHTRRDMFYQEFDAIWAAQCPHYTELLIDPSNCAGAGWCLARPAADRSRRLPASAIPEPCRACPRESIHHAIFYQRPLRLPKDLVGTCELEPNRRRCPRADRRAQRFRMLQEVNNLRLIDEGGDERALTPDERTRLLTYLADSDKRTFDQIAKHLGFLETVRFNFQRGERKALFGMPTDKALAHKDLFGKAWHERHEEDKNRIVRCLLDDEEPVIIRRATTEWGLTPEHADRLAGADLQPGYMSFCREAIAKILPHLERGLPLMTDDQTPCALVEAGYLRPDQRAVARRDSLPEPPDLPNPIVRQALHEVRKVVNAIIREHGHPERIHVELAREVKGSLEQRKQYTWKIRQREQVRDIAAGKIREAGFTPNRETINRYLLWEEQGGLCIYTGQIIGLAQLMGGEADVDHILPKARSLDDSGANKVVCYRSANHEKRDRTPCEWLAETDPARYEQVCQRARERLPYGKYRKFLQKNVELDEFIHRQLTDTAYISRAVREYLLCLVEHPHDILCTKGQLTAELRHGWGLNEVLRDDGLNLKNREDHRHHAVDAIVIALTDRSMLQHLASEGSVPPPRPEFRAEVEALINAINVSHRVQRRVSGALHEDTIYGPTATPGEFVRRKELSSLTANEISAIRDPAIRDKVLARLREFNCEPGRGKDKIPAEVWKTPLWMNQEKGIAIRRVRLVKEDKTIQPIRNGDAFIKPGSTHHLCIFELPDAKRTAVFVTMLEAARRAARGEPIIRRIHPDRPDAKFVLSLSRNETVLLEDKGQELLCRFETAASTSQQMQFRMHYTAGKSDDKRGRISKMPNTLKVRKVTVDPLGRLRWAND